MISEYLVDFDGASCKAKERFDNIEDLIVKGML